MVGNMEKHDVVYILKNGIIPDELRYSLRSIEKNLPHGKVWFVGGQPNGLVSDKALPMLQKGLLKWERARDSMLAICKNNEVSDRFWLFNDDFFLLKPVTDDRPMFGGMLRDHILRIEHRHGDKRTEYTRALRYCESVLIGAGLTTFDYALHVPMVIDKVKMLETLDMFPYCPMFRTLYGNYAEIGGVQHDDVKIIDLYEHMPNDADYVSTSDSSFHHGLVGRDIKNMFPEECRYEQTVRKKVL